MSRNDLSTLGARPILASWDRHLSSLLLAHHAKEDFHVTLQTPLRVFCGFSVHDPTVTSLSILMTAVLPEILGPMM